MVKVGRFYNWENKMFTEKYAEESESLWNVCGGFAKGHTIPWPVLESAMGRARVDVGGWHLIERLRRRLRRDRDITTLPDTCVGLRLLTDSQAATEIPRLRQKKARRQIARGLRETAAVDQSQLTTREAANLAIARQHMKAERLALSRGTREVEILSRPTARVSPKVF